MGFNYKTWARSWLNFWGGSWGGAAAPSDPDICTAWGDSWGGSWGASWRIPCPVTSDPAGARGMSADHRQRILDDDKIILETMKRFMENICR